ncbi:MAG: hypothetical protein ACE366_30650 [Bradymonadia bacterium]
MKTLTTCLLALSLSWSMTACDDDSDDSGAAGAGGAVAGAGGGEAGAGGGEAGAGGGEAGAGGGEAGAGGGEAGAGGGEAGAGGDVGGAGGEAGMGGGGEFSDACIDACTTLADCSANSDACPGITPDTRDAFYDACLPTCEANPALRALVNGEDCDGTVNTLRGLNADFDAGCIDDEGGVEPFSDDEVQELYNNTCAPCHIGGGASGGLSLDDHVANTVGVVANQVGELSLIEPGDVEGSYLWHKLVGTHADVGGSGQQMPLGAGPWSQENLDRFAAWIESL